MPRKILSDYIVPTLITERLRVWGKVIRTQRVRQRISADNLCARIGVSRATLSRLERGDPAVNVAGYLSAFMALGILDQAMPLISAQLWSSEKPGRVRVRQTDVDDDDF